MHCSYAHMHHSYAFFHKHAQHEPSELAIVTSNRLRCEVKIIPLLQNSIILCDYGQHNQLNKANITETSAINVAAVLW